MMVGRRPGRPEADEEGFFAGAAVPLMGGEGRREGGREGELLRLQDAARWW